MMYINPYNNARTIYEGREKKQCECCGYNRIILTCRKCGKELSAPLAIKEGWQKHGFREKREYWQMNIPDTYITYSCPDCN